MGTMQQIREKDVDGFLDYIQKTGTTVCGRYSIGVLLAMLPNDAEVKLLRYDTSGRLTGDFANSVSYLSIAFTGTWPNGRAVAAKSSDHSLSDADKQRLLKLARATLAYALDHRRLPTAEQLDIEITAAMKPVCGVFVTLNKRGRLRGCIGEIIPTRPLYKAIMTQAVNAGLNDQRFPPVHAAELSEIDFEISVLTPPKPVASTDEIVIGKHGIILKKAGRSAVYLPQVAPEQGWDVDQTLSHLSQKAGLSEDAWRSSATFTVFEAIVFGEGHE
jgi:MEMO1 family protein